MRLLFPKLRITVLVGLPGSGKTYLGNSLQNESRIYIDDIRKDSLRTLKDLVEKQRFPDIIISDVWLCLEKDRGFASGWFSKHAPDYEVEWIFFENSPEKCLANVKRRNANGDCRKVEGLIRQLAKEYVIPEGVEVRQIYSTPV